MERVCFQLQVRPDRLDEYRERHAAVWPEMLKAIHASGWHNYSLFLREDGLLIGYFETPDLEAAQAAMDHAYVPYSDFPVGAAAYVDDGRIVAGCNVENASYGVSLCAECSMVSQLAMTGGGLLTAFACVDGDGRQPVSAGPQGRGRDAECAADGIRHRRPDRPLVVDDDAHGAAGFGGAGDGGRGVVRAATGGDVARHRGGVVRHAGDHGRNGSRGVDRDREGGRLTSRVACRISRAGGDGIGATG